MNESRKGERLWNRAVGVLERGRAELTKLSRVGKLKLDLAHLQRSRKSVCRKLGEDTYALIKDSRFQTSEVEKYVERLSQLEESIHRLQAEIDSAAKNPPKEEL